MSSVSCSYGPGAILIIMLWKQHTNTDVSPQAFSATDIMQYLDSLCLW